MIPRRLLVTGLAMSMCLNQMPPTVLVKAAPKQASKFEVETTQSKASKYGYIKPAGQSYATNPKSKLKKANQLPTKFGSTNKTVRNQNPWGTCWAFAGIGSFEYVVDQKEGSDEDYSEEHMIQRLSKNGDTGYQITSKNTGGNEYMYSGYFTSGMGPVEDGFFPYNTKNSTLQLTNSILNATGQYRATDIQFFKTSDDANGALSSDTMNTVKQAVYENGSATCAITWDSSMIQNDGVSYYNSENGARDETNHEILIVGWDDDYSADHFDGVNKNGAWLIRNSWGNNMGDQGYFWVSYQDKSLVPSCSIKNYEEVGENDTIYNLDEGGALYPQVSYGGYSHVGFVNSFSLKKREKLKEVTFYEAETGAKYQLFYVPVKDDGSLDMEKKKVITEKKTLAYPGYHTEKITEDISVKKAAIMVMIDSNEEDAGFGAEGSISDGRKQLYVPTLEKGQSYIYVDNDLMDLYDMGADFGNWSIKLVTDEAEPAFYSKKYNDQADLGSFSWTGRPVKPDIGEIYSEDDDEILKNGVDYKIEYSNNTDPGIATMKIIGLNDYMDCSLTFTYKIENRAFHINGHKNGDDLGNKDWTGKEINYNLGNILSDYNDKVLEEGVDYKIESSNNKDVGIATIKVIGIGDYEGCVLTFTYHIVETCGYGGFYAEDQKDGNSLGSVKWTGNEIKKNPGVIRCKHCDKELIEGTDYELKYSDNVNPGTATVKVVGIGKYEGNEMTFTYTIEHKTFHVNDHKNNDNVGTIKWTGKEVKYNLGSILSDHENEILEENVDYKLEYSNDIEPGTAAVKVIGIGDYKGCEFNFTYTVEPDCGYGGFYVELHNDHADLGTFDWTGKEVQPYLGKILCRHCSKELEAGIDYKIEYQNNTNPGAATMKVIGINKYAGYEQSFTYTIGHKTFTVNDHKDGDSLGSVKWTGSKLTYDLGYIFDVSGKQLIENEDYKVEYSDNVEPGTAKVKVTGLGEYANNSYAFTFEITEDCGYGGFYAKDLEDGTSLGSYKWTGEAIEKHPTKILCKHCDRELLEGTDYTIQYENNVDPGTVIVKIIGLNQFKGYEKTYRYTIEHKTFHNSRFEDGEDLGTIEWTGKETTIELGRILSDHQDELLVEGKDYEVTYSNNIEPGTAKVTITGLGDYKGCEMSFTYTIHKTIHPTTTETKPTTEVTKKKITSVSGIKNVTYTGKTIKQKLVVKDGKTTLKENKQYKISYKNNKNCGIATVTITGIGDYKGTITKTFKIAPKKATIHSLKGAKKAATVMIRKNDGGVTGYEISYSYKKNFKGSKVKVLKKFKYKTVKIKKKKYTVTSYKMSGLKKKKTVYFKVRSYKQVGKTKVYGSWSSVKKVKIK